MRLLKKESGDSGEFSLGPLAIRFGHRPPATASHEAEREEKRSHQQPLEPLQSQGAGQDSRRQSRRACGRACSRRELPPPRAVRHGPISLCRTKRLSHSSPRVAGWPQKGGPSLRTQAGGQHVPAQLTLSAPQGPVAWSPGPRSAATR